MTTDQSTFETAADQTLARIMDVLEDALGDWLSVDLEGGILTIELDEGGQYVINKHGPNRQIWLSSPVSGAAHFNYDGGGSWVATRGQGSLVGAVGGGIDRGHRSAC